MRAFLTLLLIALAIPTAAAGQSGKDAAGAREDRRWVPGIAVMMTLSGMGTDSSIASNVRPTEDPGAISEETQINLFGSIGGSAELLSPVLLDVQWKPRVFVHADLLPTLTTDRKLAFEGAAGELVLPPNQFFPEEAIEGQGSRTSLDLASLAYGAGAGVMFSFELFDFEFKLKPSVEWYRFSGTFRGLVTRAFKPDFAAPIQRTVRLEVTERRTWNAVGGGLELEVDVIESGAFKGAVFLTGRGYSIVGDRSLSETVTSPATPVDDVATFKYKSSPYLYNFGVGFRLRWTGR